jgi:hypothetical protein
VTRGRWLGALLAAAALPACAIVAGLDDHNAAPSDGGAGADVSTDSLTDAAVAVEAAGPDAPLVDAAVADAGPSLRLDVSPCRDGGGKHIMCCDFDADGAVVPPGFAPGCFESIDTNQGTVNGSEAHAATPPWSMYSGAATNGSRASATRSLGTPAGGVRCQFDLYVDTFMGGVSSLAFVFSTGVGIGLQAQVASVDGGSVVQMQLSSSVVMPVDGGAGRPFLEIPTRAWARLEFAVARPASGPSLATARVLSSPGSPVVTFDAGPITSPPFSVRVGSQPSSGTVEAYYDNVVCDALP